MHSEIDRPIARLILDLEERGLLDRTLVIIASRVQPRHDDRGRCPAPRRRTSRPSKTDVIKEMKHYGLHRHFTGGTSVVMFGGGMKRGFVYGATAENARCVAIENPVSIEDLHATIFTAMGISPEDRVRHRGAAVLRHQGRQGQSGDGSVRLMPSQITCGDREDFVWKLVRGSVACSGDRTGAEFMAGLTGFSVCKPRSLTTAGAGNWIRSGHRVHQSASRTGNAWVLSTETIGFSGFSSLGCPRAWHGLKLARALRTDLTRFLRPQPREAARAAQAQQHCHRSFQRHLSDQCGRHDAVQAEQRPVLPDRRRPGGDGAGADARRGGPEGPGDPVREGNQRTYRDLGRREADQGAGARGDRDRAGRVVADRSRASCTGWCRRPITSIWRPTSTCAPAWRWRRATPASSRTARRAIRCTATSGWRR